MALPGVFRKGSVMTQDEMLREIMLDIKRIADAMEKTAPSPKQPQPQPIFGREVPHGFEAGGGAGAPGSESDYKRQVDRWNEGGKTT